MSARLARRLLDRLIAPMAQIEGVDYHLADRTLSDAAAQARAFVLVLPPLGNLNNPYYSVHPRRNDRFVAARQPLKALYPEVDFAPMAFTGHVLGTLAATCPARFSEVRRILIGAWCDRMQTLLSRLPTPGVLIDLPTPGWLVRPPIPGEGRRRVFVDPDDRAMGAETLRLALRTRRL
ncbi:MAG: hypothetical protein KJZ59_04455 [Pararhodobacter sp.]|nr:hypothetical protein [Pararhodobacter sp.]